MVAPALGARLGGSGGEAVPPRRAASPFAAALLALALSLSLSASCAAPARVDGLDEALSGGERSFRPLTQTEAEAKRPLFTDDAYEGMLRLASYAEYVESLRPVEAGPGCSRCAENRRRLERAWQTVANEELSRDGGFSQAEWGGALEVALRGGGGALRDGNALRKATASLVAELRPVDPYASYLEPPAWRAALGRARPAEAEAARAAAVGVGLVLADSERGDSIRSATGAHRGCVRVAAPLAGSPAEEAGVRAGDVVLAVDGVPVGPARGGAGAAAARLRGPAGAPVVLTLLHPGGGGGGGGAVRRVTLVRRALPLLPLSASLLPLVDGDTNTDTADVAGAKRALLLRLRYVSSAGTAALADALAGAAGSRGGVAGVVLDLRGNPGGVMEEAVASAALLLPSGAVVAQTWRGGTAPEEVFVTGALPRGQFADPARPPVPGLASAPVVVLVDRSTASAAELLAAALRDSRGATTLLGERTFGKAAVQFFFPLGDDQGGLRLTVKTWATPRGVSVAAGGGGAARGLAPDVACADHPAPAGEPPDACVRAALALIAADARGGG